MKDLNYERLLQEYELLCHDISTQMRGASQLITTALAKVEQRSIELDEHHKTPHNKTSTIQNPPSIPPSLIEIIPQALCPYAIPFALPARLTEREQEWVNNYFCALVPQYDDIEIQQLQRWWKSINKEIDFLLHILVVGQEIHPGFIQCDTEEQLTLLDQWFSFVYGICPQYIFNVNLSIIERQKEYVDDLILDAQEDTAHDNEKTLQILSITKQCLEWNPDSIYLQAAEKGYHELMTLLLPLCFDSTYCINEALTIACNIGHVEIVKDLFSKGATKVSGQAVMSCVAREESELIQLVLEYGSCTGLYTVLRAMCYNGNLEMVKLLLEAGALDQKQRHELATPLIAAVECGHLKIVELLVEYNAKVDEESIQMKEQDEMVVWPLLYACKEGYFDIAYYLLQKGSAKTSSDNDIFSQPLHYCCEKGNTGRNRELACKVAKKLLKIGAYADERRIKRYRTSSDGEGYLYVEQVENPLHIAINNGFTDMVQILLEYGGSEILQTKLQQTTTQYFSPSSLCKTEEINQLIEKYGQK